LSVLKPAGLYHPSFEHDSCGVGFIANMKGEVSHRIIVHGLEILENLTHRGAVGADPLIGDGAGLLSQIPDRFFRQGTELGFDLPALGRYGVGFVFLPQDEARRQAMVTLMERCIAEEGLVFLGWRDVPVNNACLSQTEEFQNSEPVSLQLFIQAPDDLDEDGFERRLYILRKVFSATIYQAIAESYEDFYVVSLSCRTIVYKGMFLADQLGQYYQDLTHPDFQSGLALVHQRFSTNTFPSWRLAHPYRMVAHNGEINTMRGNVNWMAARQASVSSPLLGKDMEKLWPVSYEGQSDTACFDNALEFLVQGGYSLAHAMMMMVPEAWSGNPLMDDKRADFYNYHAALMEPWDGPAALCFTDGRQIGATLDRNGLRPARYCVCENGDVILASEAGVLSLDERSIVRKWRLQPGKMLLVDLNEGQIIADDDIKAELSQKHPYGEWVKRTQIVLEDMPSEGLNRRRPSASLLDRQQAFGYTHEDIQLILAPMASTGQEPIGSMGNDAPPSVLSERPKLLYTYFKQNFAQVTNPPIDSIREELVMSLVSFIGPRPNLFDVEGLATRKRLEIRQPILTNDDLEKIRTIGDIADNQFNARTLDITYPAENGPEGMEKALAVLSERAEKAVRDGFNIIILSDRLVSADRIAIPALLATAGVHHHLIRKGQRTSVGLVVETGEAREVHHFCVLAGYGAEAINPYLAFETLDWMLDHGHLPAELDAEEAHHRYIKSIGKGILKVMAKMGISTYQSYCGAQIFDCVGLSSRFVETCFAGTSTQIEGADLIDIAADTVKRHQTAFGAEEIYKDRLDVGGDYRVRQRGETHMWQPEAVAHLQHAARTNSRTIWRDFVRVIDEEEAALTIRGQLRIKKAEEMGRSPVPLDEVEPVADIVKRFSTGAMSLGSLSREAHENLALAMNAIGGKSNTGEGGEDPARFIPLADGSSKRSAIKQVASGRFGVTTDYLVNADMIQIKVAQGAKPGEGGQLPGHKVDAVIAKIRYSTPRVGLISPPPHHDIYSIEDLAQLIFDLKNVNPQADISVKLVSEAGVGTVAAGVAKARADHITISGTEGGTGASPLTSIKHAGSPWEMGLAETHQTLMLNGLRARVALQVDGGLRTGRDVVIGALLGADEFGFSTAPLIALGCIMMRKCHLNTCPVGIATQDPVLRKRFKGLPEHVINYLFFVAEDVRQMMADLGVTRFDELIGQTNYLEQAARNRKTSAQKLNYAHLLFKPGADKAEERYHSARQYHPIESVLDKTFLPKIVEHVREHPDQSLTLSSSITNADRCFGAMISGEIARLKGMNALRDGQITFNLQGTAGQSFGAFLCRGVSLDLIGEANDYVGKGLSGGQIIIRAAKDARIVPEESIILGNTALYGAIGGECYFQGVAGERFAVRNSGALAVVEGVGDHGCEYMTGGLVVVLGPTGRNFAAGMSGGIAYVLDEDNRFHERCNLSMVELEPVPKEDDVLEMLHHHGGDLEMKGRVELSGDMTRCDEQRLFQLISNHRHYTGSEKARNILENWHIWRTRFVKVMPMDYRKALQAMQLAQQPPQAAE
jgi:glutamate synthase (NADPH/NADH) large chain